LVRLVFSGMKTSRDLPAIEWPDGMSDAEKDALRDILHAYEVAITDFENDHTVIFPSEAERLRLFFASRKKWSKQWSTPGLCMHPGCSAVSISRSHTIPMSASLKVIAENGHVATPRFGDNGVEVVLVGIREASTFPGFCQIHEAQFADFELKKKIATADHFRLQAFRTLCREICTQKHHKQKLEVALNDYRKLRKTFIATRLKQVQGSEPLEVQDVKFDNDTVENRAAEQVDLLTKHLTELYGLYHGVLDELRSGDDNTAMVVGTFNLRLPVCLSGIGVLPYQEGGATMRALCFLAIIPEASETKIIIGTAKQHEMALMIYLRDESSTALLERLESWMCHGSDHWFMTPSAWNAIPPARKDAICKCILDPSPSIADPVGFSILDGARNQILAFADAQLQAGKVTSHEVADVRKLIAEEKAKLNWTAPPATQTQCTN
jgi:hypothetical protein